MELPPDSAFLCAQLQADPKVAAYCLTTKTILTQKFLVLTLRILVMQPQVTSSVLELYTHDLLWVCF